MNFIAKLFEKEHDNERVIPFQNKGKKLKYPKIGMHQLLKKSVDKYPKLTAFEYFGKEYSYEVFYKKIKTTAKALKYIGVSKNDRVTVCMPNTPEAIITFYAINMIGATANMVHPLSSVNEIKYFLEVSESKVILTLDMFKDKVVEASKKDSKIIIASAALSMPSHMKTVYKTFNSLKEIKNERKMPFFQKKEDNIISWKEFYSYGFLYKKNDYIVNLKGAEEAVILYSGGTTGKPKGVMLSNNNFNALAFQVISRVKKAEPGMRLLTVLPIFHGFGLACGVHSIYVAGASNVLLPEFSTISFIRAVKRTKPNIILGVPTMYDAIINSGNYFPRKYLKHTFEVISGGDTLNNNLRKKINDHLYKYGSTTEVREGYGLTESVAVCTLSPYLYYKEGSIGIEMPGMDIKIVKPGTTKEIRDGKKGEICISGPTVMMGYLNEEEETNKTLKTHEDGKKWLHTGDLGYINKEGIVFFESRLKRMIVSSGYNIYPNYLEKILNTHPAVKEAVVVGIPDSFKGEVPIANIVLNDNYTGNSKLVFDLKRHLRKSASKYAVPYKYEFINAMPKTLMQKINYRKLEELNTKKYTK